MGKGTLLLFDSYACRHSNGGGTRPSVEPESLGVGSTDRARQRLSKSEIQQLKIGIIGGISGILLNEGMWSNFDIISLTVGAHKQYPDARAAAKVIQAINKLKPELKIEVKPLLGQAEEIENRLKVLRRQAKPVEAPPRLEIYR